MPPFDLAPYRPIAVDDLVRVGRDHDGGYVISRRTMDAARVLVGLGINDDWSFEEAFVRINPNVRVVGVDGSVSAGVFRSRARSNLVHAAGGLVRARRSILRRHWRSAREHLALASSMTRFFDGHRHHFVPRFFATADGPTAVTWEALGREYDVFGDGDAACDVFLKMDIEGAEYGTLWDVVPHAGRFAGAVVEFHDLDREWDRFAALMDALRGPLAIAHVHGNNCAPLIPGSATPTVLEVTFVNRRLLGGGERPSPRAYPVAGLDMPNAAPRPDYPLAL